MTDSLSRRLEREAARLSDRLERGDPLWPAQVAVGLTIVLHLALSDKVVIGPTWLLPSVEGVLLVVLVIDGPARAPQRTRRHRRFALFLIALVSVTNLVSIGLLVNFLVSGGQAGGHRLILSGVVLWVTNVLLFAVWYWELDRGGPGARFRDPKAPVDFLFPQMSPDVGPANWRPAFLDYLYTSLTNSTAFSPTDTMPLTRMAKVLMGIQGVGALAIIGLVVARAVNILG